MVQWCKTYPVSSVFILALPEQITGHHRAMCNCIIQVTSDGLRLKPVVGRIQKLQRLCKADFHWWRCTLQSTHSMEKLNIKLFHTHKWYTLLYGLVSSRSENISVSFHLPAPGHRLTLWCALGLLVGGAIQMPQLQLQLQCYKMAKKSHCSAVKYIIKYRFVSK